MALDIGNKVIPVSSAKMLCPEKVFFFISNKSTQITDTEIRVTI